MEIKILSFEMRAYRRLLQILYTAHVTNAKVRSGIEGWIGETDNLKGHCIEFKYYADGIGLHSGLTPRLTIADPPG